MSIYAVLPTSIRSVLLVAFWPDHAHEAIHNLPEKVRKGQFLKVREIMAVLDTLEGEEGSKSPIEIHEEVRQTFEGAEVSFRAVVWRVEEKAFLSDTGALFRGDFGLRALASLTWLMPA